MTSLLEREHARPVAAPPPPSAGRDRGRWWDGPSRLRATLTAAAAVALTTSAVGAVFAGRGWVAPVLAAIAVVAGVGLVARRYRVPELLQPVLALLAAALLAAVLDARSTFWYLLPTPSTVGRLDDLVRAGLHDVSEHAAPAPTTTGLVLLAVLGVAAVAVAVDLAAVTLRRPAVAGLPLLVLFAVPAGTLPGGIGWLPFVLGATGWLALLVEDSGRRTQRWGVTLSGTGPRRRTGDTHSSGRVGRRVGLTALAVAVVVPALVPVAHHRLFDSGSGTGEGGSRTTVTYNPLTALAGQLRLPQPRTLLTYRTSDDAPDYLRLTTLDRFDDSAGWSSSELSADVRRDTVTHGIALPDAARDLPSVAVRHAIEPRALGGPWLPVPDLPNAVDVPGTWLWDARSETVFSTRTSVDRISGVYSVTSQRLQPSPALLRQAAGVPGEIAPYAVPPKVTPYVRDLALQVTRGAATPYDKAVALQSFFRERANGFVYSDDTGVPGVNSPNALEAFLRGRRGFCEQYASAMAAMARELGIPARVAVGFTPGSRDATNGWTVTTSDAHAWPEIWFSTAGWVRFEPTPRGDQVSVPSYSLPPVTATGGANGATQPTAAPAPTTGPDAAAGSRGDKLADPGGFKGAGSTSQAASRWRTVALGVALLVLLLAVPALLAALRRRALWRHGDASAAWARTVEDAVDVGHRFRPSESPRAAAQRLLAERALGEGPAAALLRLTDAVEREWYARDGGDVALEQLRADVREVRAGLLLTVRPPARWVARLLPPSALRWAASSLGTAAADVLDRADGAVAGVGARVRRTG